MRMFRPIDCLSMAYGMAVMAVVILAICKCWLHLTITACIAVVIWCALIQRGRD